jgi:hypothetical protein
MIRSLIAWMSYNEALLGWLFALSVLLFIGSLVVVPWLVTRIPADYFLRPRHLSDRWHSRHPLVRLAFFAAKNLCGIVLVIAGIAMLVLPGQGILTILVGIVCIDFPGKFALEQRLVRERHVTRVINWIRSKANQPPLQVPR